MIGLSWNAWGLGNPRAFAALRRLLKNHSPDFVFLLETKINGNKVSKLRDVFGYSGCFSIDCVGNNGGLMLLWKDNFVVTVLSFSSGHIYTCVRMEDGFLRRFSGFYGEPNSSKRNVSWALFQRLSDINKLPWLCGGDFNELFGLMCNKKVVSCKL